jgi:hypothetical protein
LTQHGRGRKASTLSEHHSPTPVLLDLRRVVPVGQTQAHEGVSVELLSVELYTDGFIVNGRILAPGLAGDETNGAMFLVMDNQSRVRADDGLGGD